MHSTIWYRNPLKDQLRNDLVLGKAPMTALDRIWYLTTRFTLRINSTLWLRAGRVV